jgi:GNAT superfamily N-acetyltransferase
MKLRVRRAQHRDEPRILDLLLQVNNVHADGRPDIFIFDQRKYTDGQLSILIDDETRPIFVAVDNDEYVYGYGFCIVTAVKDGSNLQPIKTLYIDDLCVDQTVRRMGTGQIIYDFIKDYAKEIGCYHLTLNVWACNPSAMKFYEKQGMQMLKKEMEIIL